MYLFNLVALEFKLRGRSTLEPPHHLFLLSIFEIGCLELFAWGWF
jgi:hypothetical protein